VSLDLRKMRRQRFRGSHSRSFSFEEWQDQAVLGRFFNGMSAAIGHELLAHTTAEHDLSNDRLIVRWRTR
jgi:hypothetical protein